MMDIITIDFETYYDREFSLSKMTTEEYIRDSRFEVIGVAVKVNGGITEWFSGTKEKTKAFLNKFNWADAVAVAHNAMFDMAILSWQFGIRPKRIVDTLSMARALHGTEVGGSLATLAEHYALGVKGTEVLNALGKRRIDFDLVELAKYGEYCINDVDLTYKLFGALADGFPLPELKLIDMTIRMFTEPKLVLDHAALLDHSVKVKLKKAELLEKVEGFSKDDLMSNPKLAEVLKSLGVEPPMKVSPTTGKEAYAFAKSDEEFKALLEHESLQVQAIVAARLGVKSTLEETRTDRFIGLATRGAMPVPLKYYAAHTGRWGGSDALNLQNLPRSSPLKNAICAPDGYYLIDSDSSQIEARTLAWLAEQDDLVEFFEKNNAEIAAGVKKKDMQYDPYRIMASQIYGIPVHSVTDALRFVGKSTLLGAGYGMGAAKFKAQLKTFGVDLAQEECERIIQVYRATYPRIPLLWKQAGEALEAMMREQSAPLGRAGVLSVEGEKGIRLPNGLYIKYPGLRKVINDAGKEEIVYNTKKGKAVIPNRIYGGKVVENCIAEGTEVLTDRGWVRIENITDTDKVHDGVEFVNHGGIVFKSIQPCVTIDGVYMTADHEVLTNEGWQAASQNPKPYRPNIRHVDGVKPRTERWAETVVEVSMPMRESVHQKRGGCHQGNKAWWVAKLWLRNGYSYIKGTQNTWHVEASSIRSMEVNARPMSAPLASSMEKLRRAWDNSMRKMARSIPKLLGRHGGNIYSWFGPQPKGQRWAVLSGELCMEYATGKHDEQKKYGAQSRRYSPKQGDRYSAYNTILSSSSRMACGATNAEAKPEKPVYDIMDAGVRSRFVVRGGEGPFIVHNCCQALARIVIGEQMLLINKRYPVVMTVHDAIACLVPEAEKEAGEEFVTTAMRVRPDWALDLPLNCEAGVGKSYGEC